MAKKANETQELTVVKPTNGNGKTNGNGTAKTAQTEVKNVEVSELQKQIAEMQKQFETLKSENEQLKQRKPLSLSERLEMTNKLNELIANREKFLKVKNTLSVMPEIENTESLDFDETPEFRLTLFDGNEGYEMFSIANTFVINEAKNFLLQKIDTKVNEIETEIQNLDI